ncbi:MAG TPA: HdeD family acid-resistance protein [Polyangiaceae bacterium]|nr:HdeD family acid-resistance protein [Polyangiaceae bacterium]
MEILLTDRATLTRHWWAFLLRGIAAILFSALTFFAPHVSLATLVLVFGAYALVDGLFALILAIRRTIHHRSSGLLVLQGVLGIAAGICAWLFPQRTVLALVYIIAVWAILTGLLEIAAGVLFRRWLPGHWFVILGGAVSLMLGVALFAYPGPGALALVLWVGAYALLFGVLLLSFAFKVRAWRNQSQRSASAGTGYGLGMTP